MRSCLICDDHAMMREALTGVLRLHWPDVDVTTANDFAGGWRAATACPDLILCDLGMPGALPVEGIQKMQTSAPDASLVVVTASEDN